MRYYIFIFVLCCYAAGLSPVSAQLMTNDNVTLTVKPGAQVTVKGDVHNRNNADIDNNGTLDLSGNWIHDAANNCFGASQGTVILNGGNQSIGGSQMTVFNNLTLAGSGTKTLLLTTAVGGAYLAPAGVLDVGNVALNLNANTVYVLNSSTGAITSGSGYILSENTNNLSKVNWDIGTTLGAHSIPFGTVAGVQIPFTFNLTSGSAGEVVVSTYPTAAANTPYPVAPVPVTHVRNVSGTDNSAFMVDRFWQVDPTGSPTAILTFSYPPVENAANGNTNVRAQRWNDPTIGWSPPTPGQTNPTAQSVQAPGITTFGPWALALDVSPLPVELLSFTAAPEDNERVICAWITATEINNDYFTVERSRDGIAYEDIGEVDGAGNSTATLYYAFTDYDPYKGTSYYRLRQTDFDGTATRSKPVAVRILDAGELLLFPNPNNGTFYLVAPQSEGPVRYTIYDMAGRKVLAGTIHGPGAGAIDMTACSKGLYHVVAVSPAASATFRVAIQ